MSIGIAIGKEYTISNSERRRPITMCTYSYRDNTGMRTWGSNCFYGVDNSEGRRRLKVEAVVPQIDGESHIQLVIFGLSLQQRSIIPRCATTLKKKLFSQFAILINASCVTPIAL